MKKKFVTVGQNKIRYLEEGEGSHPIVLIHGLGGSAERWRYVIPNLSKECRIIAPDLIGFGQSDKPPVDYTMDFFKKFLFNFLNSLDIENPILIGSSLGGQILAEFAIEKITSIEKMVLVSPSGVDPHGTPALDFYMKTVFYTDREYVKRAFQLMAGPDKYIDSYTIDDFIERMASPNAKMSFMSTLLHLKNTELKSEDLSKISVPTLLIWGKEDQVIPITNARIFTSSMKNCQFVEMDGCGHTPYVDEPEKFSTIVREFLNL